MLRLAGLYCLCLLSAASAWAHPPAILNQATEKVVIDEVAHFRKQLATAIQQKDAKALRTHYTDGFMHTDALGKINGKDARIASVLAGDPAIETAPVKELVIRVPGGWTAIATGVSPIKSKADGKTYSLRWTAVYTRIGDGWQIAASQETRVAEEK